MAGDTRPIEVEGLVLDAPAGWSVLDNVEGVSLVLVRSTAPVDGFATNVNLMVSPGGCSSNVERDEYWQSAIAELGRELTDATLLDLSDAEVVGRPAKHLVATYRQGIRGLTLEQWLIPRDEDKLIVSATSRNEEFPLATTTFNEIVATMRDVA